MLLHKKAASTLLTRTSCLTIRTLHVEEVSCGAAVAAQYRVLSDLLLMMHSFLYDSFLKKTCRMKCQVELFFDFARHLLLDAIVVFVELTLIKEVSQVFAH